MPWIYVAPRATQTKKIEFWITSSRGTKGREVVLLPRAWKEDAIKDELESWCEKFACWHMGESMMQYGWRVPKRGTKVGPVK